MPVLRISLVLAASSLGSAAAATGSSNVSPGGGDSSAWSHAADRVNAVLSTARQHFSLSTGVPFIPNLHQPVGRCMPNTTGSNPGTSAAIAAAYEQQQKAPSAANMAELSSAMTAAQNLAGGSSLLGGGHLGGGGSTQSSSTTYQPQRNLLDHRTLPKPDAEAPPLQRPTQLLDQQRQIRLIVQQQAQQQQQLAPWQSSKLPASSVTAQAAATAGQGVSSTITAAEQQATLAPLQVSLQRKDGNGVVASGASSPRAGNGSMAGSEINSEISTSLCEAIPGSAATSQEVLDVLASTGALGSTTTQPETSSSS